MFLSSHDVVTQVRPPRFSSLSSTSAFASLGAPSWISSSQSPSQGASFAQQEQPQKLAQEVAINPNPATPSVPHAEHAHPQAPPVPPKPPREESLIPGAAAPMPLPVVGVTGPEVSSLPAMPSGNLMMRSQPDLSGAPGGGIGIMGMASMDPTNNPFGAGAWMAMPTVAPPQGTPVVSLKYACGKIANPSRSRLPRSSYRNR